MWRYLINIDIIMYVTYFYDLTVTKMFRLLKFLRIYLTNVKQSESILKQQVIPSHICNKPTTTSTAFTAAITQPPQIITTHRHTTLPTVTTITMTDHHNHHPNTTHHHQNSTPSQQNQPPPITQLPEPTTIHLHHYHLTSTTIHDHHTKPT